MRSTMPVVYVAHGGGPLPLLGDPEHQELTKYLKQFASRFEAPKAILVITAHWESDPVRVTANPSPTMLFDYYGFPPESYQFSYPAAGDPALAKQIVDALLSDGIDAELDLQRGFDHGTFVPLMLMYPHAKIPVVQMSLCAGLNPSQHIAIGKALTNLPSQGILVVGSGLSFHNMRAFFSADSSKTQRSRVFDKWLIDTLCLPELSPAERFSRLASWDKAPEARFCHPREEHLLPLHVCTGVATGTAATHDFSAMLFGTAVSGFLWKP